MTANIKSDLLWHLKNALTKKAILLPFIAPCFVAWYTCAWIWDYIADFGETVKSKTDKEREAYIAKRNTRKEEINSKGIFAFYALTATVLYWSMFGFSRETTPLEFLNLPTYYLFGLPLEAVVQLAHIPVHYKPY